MIVAGDDTNNKCRVDQATWIHHSSAMVDSARRALIHPTTVHTQIRGPMALAQGHPGTAPHSRVGGNAYGTSLRGQLVSLEAGYFTYAQSISAFTGMTKYAR